MKIFRDLSIVLKEQWEMSKTVAQQCAEKTQIDYSKIDACKKSKLGNQLQHVNAFKTANLQPPHKYVPWVNCQWGTYRRN